MEIDPETQQRLLELAHDLLAEDEAAELRARVAAEPELAAAYAEAEQATKLFAEAAKLELPKVELRPPPKPVASRPAASPPDAARAKAVRVNGAGLRPSARRLTRGANWAVGVASLVLLVISVGGFLYHRGQLADLAGENLRLMLLGPARLRAGVAQEYTVVTTSVTGAPVSAQVEFAFFPPAGERMGHLQRTDELGRLRVTIPADRLVPGKALLEIRAKGQDQKQIERVETWVTIESDRYATQLSLDKPSYRPGETVRYRSLTLSRSNLTAGRDLAIRFEVLDPGGMSVAGSRVDGLTQRGMGCGEFPLASGLAPGRYTLVAQSLDGSVPTQRKSFLVRADPPLPQKNEAKPARDGRASGEATVAAVDFYPEGGELAAEMEHRVYFAARGAQGQPVAISGRVVDSEGRNVARLQTGYAGMGTFVLGPRAGEQYRLKLDQPGGVNLEPRLPEVVVASQVVLTTGLGVFEPGKPLEFNIRAAEAGVPLVAAARCRGVTVGEQTLVTEVKANTVSVPLADEVCGVIRLTVYDYRFSPPRPVAERLVYRQPARRLQVRVAQPGRPYSPGQTVELALEVRDESGNATPAALGVAVVRRAALQPARDHTAALPTRFLLDAEMENPEDLEDADFYLSDDPKAAVALDLLLGTQGSRRLLEKTAKGSPRDGRRDGQPAQFDAPDADSAPPALFDNLGELQARYQGNLASYHANRTRLLDTLTVMSFFGGGGLVVLVAMLSLLGIAPGVRLWTASLAVAATCLILGTILMKPERLKSPAPRAVVFKKFEPAPAQTGSGTAAKSHQDSPLPPTNLRSVPGEGQGVRAADRETGLKRNPVASPPRFTVRHYARQRERPSSAADRGSPETLFWHPMLVTDNNGRAPLRFDLPDSPGVYGVLVEAHAGGGRLGAATAEIVSGNKAEEK